MSSVSRLVALALVAGSLAACSGSSSDPAPSVTLAVTDAASDELSTFNIGLESVELVNTLGATVSLLQLPTAVDFAALGDLSRVLNVTDIPPDTYTGVEVTLLYDNNRVFLNGKTSPAMLLDSGGTQLTGTHMMPIDFASPLQVSSGNYVIELDLDLNQSTDVDTVANEVTLEPSLLPRINRNDPKEHAIGGDLRTVVLSKNLFRIDLEADVGQTAPVIEIQIAPGTVFQIDGVCLLGAAGLSTLDTLPPGTWVQAFGAVNASSRRFQALTVEAGSGSYNGGTDIVEGVITGRTGGAGSDAVLTVRGHSNDSTHTTFEFNLDYTVNTSFANTKVVRRGSATVYDTDDLNVGQRVRMFGLLDSGTNTLDVTTATDVVRMEATWIFGTANGAPTAGQLEINLLRVDLRDVSLFSWNESGTNPPTPATFVVGDPGNLGTGQGIVASTPIVALGFFAPVDTAGSDYTAGVLANRRLLPSLLLVRDRANGKVVTTMTSATSIDFTFSADPPATFEKGVIDMGFAGQTDVTGTGVSIVPNNLLGIGLYVLHDRTLNFISVHVTFAAFAQALEDALDGGAQLFNVGGVGVYNSLNGRTACGIAGVTVQ